MTKTAILGVLLLSAITCAPQAMAQGYPHKKMWKPPACYQGESYTVSGTPGELVVAETPQTGFRREATIGADGSFQFTHLNPGYYKFSTGGLVKDEVLLYTECDVPKIRRGPFGYHGERIEGQATPGALVVVQGLDSEFATAVVADKKGNYRIRYLQPGKYKVTVGDRTREVRLRYGDFRSPSLSEVMN